MRVILSPTRRAPIWPAPLMAENGVSQAVAEPGFEYDPNQDVSEQREVRKEYRTLLVSAQST